MTVGPYIRLLFTRCSIEFPVLRQCKWLIPSSRLSHFSYCYASSNCLQVNFDLPREQFDSSPTLFLLHVVRLPCDVYLQVDHIHV